MGRSRELRRQMVDILLHNGTVTSPEVEAAFLALPREAFVPQILAESGLDRVYADDALVTHKIGGVPTSSSSQPSIMALMLEALVLRPGHRVLEIGLGTGYNAALLRMLVGRSGAVTSIDIAPGVVADAREALTRTGIEVESVIADGSSGYRASAPYDRIIVTASTDVVPYAWWQQLSPDGIVVVPLRFGGMQLVAVLVRTSTGFVATRVIQGGFMPMRPSADAAGAGGVTITIDISLGDGTTSWISISGTGLATLSTDARARLVGNLLAAPRTIRDTGVSPLRALVWQGVMSTPSDRQIVVYEHAAGTRYGLVDADGAVAAMRTGVNDAAAVLNAIELYGPADHLGALLLRVAHDWHAAGEPDLDRLALAIDYHADAPVPPWAVSVTRPDRQRWCLGWR